MRKSLWPYLKGADQPREGVYPDPFADNSVHITNFSANALRIMGESLDATYVGRIAAHCHLFRRAPD